MACTCAQKMAVLAAEIAIPSAARPRLELHRHRVAFTALVPRSQLFQERGKGILQRCAHMNLLLDIQDQIFNACCIYNHASSFEFALLPRSFDVPDAFCSARSFTRFSW